MTKASAKTSPAGKAPAGKADPKLASAWKHKAGRDLTEEELLAMPDSEYMSEQQIDFFRARLMAQKNDLLSNADETTEHLREDTTIVPDRRTVPRSRKSMRWSCARATASASC